MIKSSVRWCLNNDIDRMLEIEKISFACPWDRQDFINCLSKKDHNGVVVERTKKVVGYMMFQMCDEKFKIVNIAIDSQYRLQGYGKNLIYYLQKRLTDESALSKKKIEYIASDRNLDFHLFSKRVGFKAIKIVSNHFGPNHHGYHFVLNYETTYVSKLANKKTSKTKR